MSRSVLAVLTGSTLLHGALVASLLLLTPRAEPLPPLFVDLTQEERPPGHEGGSSGSARAARLVSVGRAGSGAADGAAVPRATPPSPSANDGRTASRPETPPAFVTPAPAVTAAPTVTPAPPVTPAQPASPAISAPPVAVAPPVTPTPPVAFAPLPAEPAPAVSESKVSSPDTAEMTTTPVVSGVPSGPSAPSAKSGAASAADASRIGGPGGDGIAGGPSAPLARAGSGSGDGTSSHSAGGSGLAVVGPGEGAGAPGAAYGAYLGRLRQRVYEALRYPAAARRRGLTGTVVLELTVRPDGAIGRVVVVDSSSHTTLDQAALESVRSLGPQPFPADLPSRILHVRLPVVFELQ